MLGWISPRIFMGRAQRRLAGRGVPIFTYHRIGTPLPGTRDPYLYVSARRFEAQLTALQSAGFRSASLAEPWASAGNAGCKAVLTFDDGCRSVLEHGLPILARHNFHAVQFLVAGFIGQRNHWDVAVGDLPEPLMDEGQVREWLSAGHQIGSHSLSHPNLRHLSSSAAREEIFGSKKSLEDRFGVEVNHFCYPFGSWNEPVRDLVKEAGYHTACTVCFGINNGNTPRFELRRIIPLSSPEMLGKIYHRLARRLTTARRQAGSSAPALV
jgi:peptidoglycan/xylan/chitin deacetylase (PgdA/CDA1 family)